MSLNNANGGEAPLGNGSAQKVAAEPVETKLGDAFEEIDFTPRFSYFKSTNKQKTDFKWNNIKLQIGEKQILKGVTGHVKGGEVCALMGPSGAGKSSLLNVLAGRVVPSQTKTVTGDVFVNGKKINPAKYRRKIAYVMQEDLLYATATARESLEFSARLRLDTATANDAKKVKIIVDDLLDSLGLTKVQNTIVGSAAIRGLSGGEKKRVAIGIELVTNPNLLFLDEPTSGLDSFSAWKVVKILDSLSSATGCSVLCTIHQPSSEIFNSFRNVMILAQGNVRYNGPVSQLPYVYSALGKPIPPLTNPADYVMLLAQLVTEETDTGTYNVDTYDSYDDGSKQIIRSKDGKDLKKEESTLNSAETIKEPKHVETAGMLTQSYYLSIREFRNLRRNYGLLIATYGVRGFMNILFGLVFFKSADRDDDGYLVSSEFGAFLMILISALFSASNGPLLTFPLERGIMIREYQTGTYSSMPYFLAKIMVELPTLFLASIMSLIFAYFLIDLNGNFFYIVLVIWLISIAGASYSMVLGAAVKDAKRAQEFAPLVLVPQMLFTGLFVPITQIPVWLRWIQYIIVLKYGVNLGTLVEFASCEGSGESQEFIEQCETLLESNDIDKDLRWFYVLVLVAVFLVCRSLTLVILVLRARYFTD